MVEQAENVVVREVVRHERAENDVGVDSRGERIGCFVMKCAGRKVLLAVALGSEARSVGVQVDAGETQRKASCCCPATNDAKERTLPAANVEDSERSVADAGLCHDLGDQLQEGPMCAGKPVEPCHVEHGLAVVRVGAGAVEVFMKRVGAVVEAREWGCFVRRYGRSFDHAGYCRIA